MRRLRALYARCLVRYRRHRELRGAWGSVYGLDVRRSVQYIEPGSIPISVCPKCGWMSAGKNDPCLCSYWMLMETLPGFIPIIEPDLKFELESKPTKSEALQMIASELAGILKDMEDVDAAAGCGDDQRFSSAEVVVMRYGCACPRENHNDYLAGRCLLCNKRVL